MNTIFENKTFEEKHFLDQEGAAYRFSLIENVSYEVCLAMPKGTHFFGHVTVRFSLKEKPTKSISLDLQALSIARLSINDQLVENKDGDAQQVLTKHMVFLAPQYLNAGDNVVSM